MNGASSAVAVRHRTDVFSGRGQRFVRALSALGSASRQTASFGGFVCVRTSGSSVPAATSAQRHVVALELCSSCTVRRGPQRMRALFNAVAERELNVKRGFINETNLSFVIKIIIRALLEKRHQWNRIWIIEVLLWNCSVTIFSANFTKEMKKENFGYFFIIIKIHRVKFEFLKLTHLKS